MRTFSWLSWLSLGPSWNLTINLLSCSAHPQQMDSTEKVPQSRYPPFPRLILLVGLRNVSHMKMVSESHRGAGYHQNRARAANGLNKRMPWNISRKSGSLTHVSRKRFSYHMIHRNVMSGDGVDHRIVYYDPVTIMIYAWWQRKGTYAKSLK